MTNPERDAQRWHDDQVMIDLEHRAEFSSCWCCCMYCNPDWVCGDGNPYFEAALAALRARS